jgi:hypothetical protein
LDDAKRFLDEDKFVFVSSGCDLVAAMYEKLRAAIEKERLDSHPGNLLRSSFIEPRY